MKHLRLLFSVILFSGILFWLLYKSKAPKTVTENLQAGFPPLKDMFWHAPDSSLISKESNADLIRYGKKLIINTAKYFGPHGAVSHYSNGMNCENCHLQAGTRIWAGNFGAVAAVYPRFSERRGARETIYQRISDCFERSLNGTAPDSNSLEMRAIHAYISWLGKGVKKGIAPLGTGLETPDMINRAADAKKGETLYVNKCQRCHSTNGEGQTDSSGGYIYPPLWGEHSYNTSAGMYRLTKFAGFIKENMPFGIDYRNEQLTAEEAWDLAAYVNSQPRSQKKFKKDWPDISSKPIDLPDGPFSDSLPAIQHKYGPFLPIEQYINRRRMAFIDSVSNTR